MFSALGGSVTRMLDPVHRSVEIDAGDDLLRGELLLPPGSGRVPGIVYNHGSEASPSLEWLGETARWFRDQGFAVLVLYRRGASGSAGPHWSERVDAAERSGDSRDTATVAALEEDLRDVMVGGAWLAALSRVDAQQVVVGGCSFGGVLSLLAAEHPSPFRAALDFAGASMMWATYPAVRTRMVDAARSSAIPVFFLQAENDFNTEPTQQLPLENPMHRGRVFPAVGATPRAGHAGFCNRAQASWGPDVLEFFRDVLDTPPSQGAQKEGEP